MSLSIGPYEVDLATRRIIRSGHSVNWGDKACHLFVILLENAPQTISKEDIFEQVWSGRVVTENSLYKTISKLRKELNKDQIEIESVFGEGYRIISNLDETHTSTSKTKTPLFSISSITIVLLILSSLIWFGYQHMNSRTLFNTMKELNQLLAVSKQAFISQINRRNELGQLLSQRFELNQQDSWEKRFYQLHDQMNEQELFLCQQIRAFTEGPLYEKNQAALDLIVNNPDIVEELPLAQDMITHLTIWLNKYHRVFEQSEKMCLLYVGVEDGAKYPSDFDGQLAEWLRQNQ